MTATDLKKRAIELSEKTKIDSVTPEEVGQLSNDIVEYIENVEINGSSLGIRKTYTSVSAMEADSTAPKDDKGVLLRRGMLVNIYNQEDPDSADNGKVFSFQNPGWAFRGTIDAGYATRDELTELDLAAYGFEDLPTEGNLLNPNKVIKGLFVNNSGKFQENEAYGIVYIPMRGKSISTNEVSGGFLAAADKHGNITHINSESTLIQKTLLYEEGDYFAIVSVYLSRIGKSAAISYGEDIPKYSEYGFFLKEKGNELAAKVEKAESDIKLLNFLTDKDYSYSTELGIETINTKVITGMEILNGEEFSVSANGTAEWSGLLFQFKSADEKEQRVDAVKKGETRKVIAEIDIVSINLYVTTTQAGEVSININRAGEFTKLKEEVENPTEGINGNRIADGSVGLIKLSSDIIEKSKNLFNPNDADVKIGYYLAASGELLVNENYIVSGFIPFTEDMKNLQASIDGKAISGGGFSLLYNSEKVKVNSFSNNTSKGLLNWQEDVAFARFSFNIGDINNNLQVEQGDKVTVFQPYGGKILESLLPEETDISILSSSLGNDADTVSKDTLNDSETLTLENFPWHIKKRLVMSFSASITTFNSILIGKGLEQYRGDYIKIDSTNITQLHYEQEESQKETTAHGLTIDTFIKVSLLSDNSGYLYFILQSKTGTFKYVFKQWAYEANWTPFAKSIGSILTDLKFNAGCQDFQLPVWAFGDSYFGISSNRWIGAIRDLKFFNFLVNGLAGQGSSGAYNDLLRCLRFGTPKYLLWCLGMNDGDSSFISVFDKVKYLCESKGITLIAATIPTVPERDKEVISQYVRDSGVRYIDFYKAMGTNSEGSWYEGYLDSDKVHPTSLGAQAQAMEVLVDFPELMQYGLTSTEGEIGDTVGDK